jgi:hypothetical protein
LEEVIPFTLQHTGSGTRTKYVTNLSIWVASNV